MKIISTSVSETISIVSSGNKSEFVSSREIFDGIIFASIPDPIDMIFFLAETALHNNFHL
jgi:hypothetical protein